jgi:hypothetical protein
MSMRACLRRLRFALLAAGATVVILLGMLAGLTSWRCRGWNGIRSMSNTGCRNAWTDR